ncbi:hypothetical protein LWX53_06195 [bacterium]|nr:hypothetical protein [bacterium]
MTEQDRKKLEAEIEAFLDTQFIREEIPPLTPEGVAAFEKREGKRKKILFPYEGFRKK